jgi:hypothetical protein
LLNLCHTPGQENVVADALSRPLARQGPLANTQPKPAPLPTSFTAVAEDWLEEGLAGPEQRQSPLRSRDILAMAAQQQSCPEVAEMLNSGNLQFTS